jgi:hypothetical protein
MGVVGFTVLDADAGGAFEGGFGAKEFTLGLRGLGFVGVVERTLRAGDVRSIGAKKDFRSFDGVGDVVVDGWWCSRRWSL